MNLNPVSALSWSWRTLRGHSVTSAALFASAILGLSILSGVRHLLGELGAPWYLLFLGPILIFGYLGRKETEWIPEAQRRRTWARRLFFGSIAIAFLLAWLRPAHHAPQPPHGQRNVQGD